MSGPLTIARRASARRCALRATRLLSLGVLACGLPWLALAGCAPASVECHYDGASFPLGWGFSDGCNDCWCAESGEVHCTLVFCTGPDTGCIVTGCDQTVCASGPIATECGVTSTDEWYCYRRTRCIPTRDLRCVWEDPAVLEACLADVRLAAGP